MPKLTKQQIIILCITLLVVMYGGYELLIKKSRKVVNPDAGRKQELSNFMASLGAGTGGSSSMSRQAHIVNRAEAVWKGDPFLRPGIFKDWMKVKAAAKALPEKISFTYTGYVETGRKAMAIINGIEYGVGDTLDIGGYAVKSISPERVVIEKKSDGSSMDIPINEYQ